MLKPVLMMIASCFVMVSCGQAPKNAQTINAEKQQTTTTMNDTSKIQKTDAEWKKILSPEQYYVLRQKGTESPFSGKYVVNNEKGMYVCAACGNELFTTDMQFESHCGWPSFDKEIAGGKIKTNVDSSHGMIRTEITCGKCGSHLGHLFDDGPTETGQRYCVNSLSLDFKKATGTEKK